MRLFRTLSSLPSSAQGAVVALGNFDGVHRGHQCVLGEAFRLAKALNAPLAVMTFEPHPRRFFNPSLPPLAIYPFHDKVALLAQAGVEILYIPRFNASFSRLSALDFARDVLGRQLRVRHVVTGENFVFGADRQGDADYLAAQARQLGFGYTALPTAADHGGALISSSRIRSLLKDGDMQAASQLLGRPYSVSGHVCTGDRRGRQMGFPTANLELGRIFQPAAGVYAAEAVLPDQTVWPAVANFGTRPTVDGHNTRLEVHLTGFNGDLYGQRLQVRLLSRLREEKKFDTLEALAAQIARDVNDAEKFRISHAAHG